MSESEDVLNYRHPTGHTSGVRKRRAIGRLLNSVKLSGEPHLLRRTKNHLNGCERQKARTVWSIGIQPAIPAVYGVKAPL